MSKSSKNSFLMQGMILAAASIVCRVIGLLYRSPLFGIIGEEGMGYYSYAYNIYNIILLIASFSIPLAVSKSISARLAKREYINAQRIFYGALVYAIVVRIFWSTNLCWTSERCRTCSSGDLSNHLFLWNPWSIKRIFSGA